MKTKLFLIALAFGLMSGTCESDSIQEEAPNCKCGIIIDKTVFTIPNNTFTKLTLVNECTNDTTYIQVVGNQGTIGAEYCQ